jgi:hypothetical protein
MRLPVDDVRLEDGQTSCNRPENPEVVERDGTENGPAPNRYPEGASAIDGEQLREDSARWEYGQQRTASDR